MQPLSTDAVAKLHQNFQTKVQQLAAKAAGERTDLVAPLADYTSSFVSAFNASRGRWPKVEELQRLAEKGAEGIKAAADGLPANLATFLFKEHAALPSSHHNHHADVFGDADRLYFELKSPEADKIKGIPKNIQNWLSQQGYEITDPEKGLVSNDGKNHTRIGRLLQKNGLTEMLESYTLSRSESADTGMMMVVSRKPEDIARCSSARAWTSCMSEFSSNARYVTQDIKHGSLVAYLVSRDDPDITNPLARRLIKPYTDEQGEMIMMPDNGYGISNSAFKHSAYDFCAEYFNKGKTGEYTLHTNLYPDGIIGFRLDENGSISERTEDDLDFDYDYLDDDYDLDDDSGEMRNLPPHLCHGDCTAEDLLDYLGYRYEKNDDGQIVVLGYEVDLSKLPLTALPDMSHVVCDKFDCSRTSITHLHGAPQKVAMFNCSDNELLTTLEGGPLEAHIYKCQNTGISNLKGAPQKVAMFDCGGNRHLTTLEGGPLEAHEYRCPETGITNLKGAPQKVVKFNCSYNEQLTTLEGGPLEAHRYSCLNTSITNLKGAPQKVDEFVCMGNRQLTTLEDGPLEARKYDCSNSGISSLKGAPQKVDKFNCSGNSQLTTLEGGPLEAHEYRCNETGISNLKGAPQKVAEFDCSYNKQLTTLEGGPLEVDTYYKCRYTGISNLKGAPQKVPRSDYSYNKHLTTLEDGLLER